MQLRYPRLVLWVGFILLVLAGACSKGETPAASQTPASAVPGTQAAAATQSLPADMSGTPGAAATTYPGPAQGGEQPGSTYPGPGPSQGEPLGNTYPGTGTEISMPAATPTWTVGNGPDAPQSGSPTQAGATPYPGPGSVTQSPAMAGDGNTPYPAPQGGTGAENTPYPGVQGGQLPSATPTESVPLVSPTATASLFTPLIQPGAASTPTPPGFLPTATLLPTAMLLPSATLLPTSTFTPIPTSTPTPTPTPTLLVTLGFDVQLHASDPARFQLVANKPQLVEFFAFWDGASQAMAPLIGVLEKKYGAQVNFVYLDIDDPAVSVLKHKLGYKSQPHLFLIDTNGKILKQWMGYVKLDDLDKALQSQVSK